MIYELQSSIRCRLSGMRVPMIKPVLMKSIVALFLFALWFSVSLSAQETPLPSITIEKVKVFPNPATHVVNVLGLKNSGKADITITDLYGYTIISVQWEIKNNAVNLPISELEPGIYVISIRSSEENNQIKFYKQ